VLSQTAAACSSWEVIFVNENSGSAKSMEERRIRWYWIGLITQFLIFLNVVRIAGQVPYQLLALGAVFNMAILGTIVFLLQRAYKRLRQ
jgi:hypothetical protein